MMKRLVAMLAGALLMACGGNVRTIELARYDFGALAANGVGAGVPLATLDVQAASWLAGPGMHFRLAYVEPLRRQSYAESRWAAPPAELLEALLKRRVVFSQPDFNGAGCRLHLVLEELEQRFDDPQHSVQVLDARAVLTPFRGAEILAKRTFPIRTPAPTADARGGAAATRDAVQALTVDIGSWLGEIARAKPAIVERCRTY